MQRRTSLTTCLVTCAAVLVSSQATAQTSPSHSRLTGWLAVNYGWSLASPEPDPVPVLALDLQFQRNHGWFGLRVADLTYDNGNMAVGELALLYGRAMRRTRWQGAIGAGLSVIAADNYQGGIGLAFTARAAVRPLAPLGLGAQFMGNLFSSTPFCAWTLFLEIGKLR